MNPARRILLQVTWDSTSDADELFTLSWRQVEIRRACIEDYAFEVKNVDI